MLLEILIAILLGVTAGIITGLTPGIHINLIGAILVSLYTFFISITNPIIIIIFIVSMAITHTFIDFIPSIFLGAPDEDTILSVLPGHEMLKEGKGYEAIFLSAYGSLAAIIIILIISPIFILFLPKIEPSVKFLIPYLLIIATIFLISKEKYKINAIIIFFLSGFLGIAVLNSNLKEPFLPLLSGLFGASSIIISIKSKTKIPKQRITKPKISKKELINSLIPASCTSPLMSFLPGMGAGQAATLASSFIKINQKSFLILLGATNTIVLGLSFIVLYSIGKERTGMASVSKDILQDITLNHIIIILTTMILVGITSFYLTLYLGKLFTKNIHKLDYTKISIMVLFILSAIVLLISGTFGFFSYLISTATGIYGIMSGVKRINLMGCLVLPVVLWYLI
ncbi:MAG: tripartite tricarboxylate transporter permease [Candidatus Pacearchaeota archaeon]